MRRLWLVVWGREVSIHPGPSNRAAALVSFRQARLGDFKYCSQLYVAQWLLAAVGGPLETNSVVESLRRRWEVGQVRIRVCGGRDIGWLQCVDQGDVLFLEQLFVEDPLRRRGIGTQVMRQLIDEAARSNRGVRLGVVKANPALRLYERLGFEITHEDDRKFYMQYEPVRYTMTLPEDWRPAAVVFDCDGLLVDTETCWAVAESEVFARRGLGYGPAQNALVIGKSVTDAAREMARAFGTPDDAPDIEHELLDLVPRAIADNARAMRGAVSIVERVRRLLPMAVASNSPRGLLDLALEQGGFSGTFPISVAADEVSAPKPAPEMYLEACRRLGVTPGQALAFEDSMTGIRAAQAAGLKVVCIPTLKELDYPADAVFASLDDHRLLAWLDKWSSAPVP